MMQSPSDVRGRVPGKDSGTIIESPDRVPKPIAPKKEISSPGAAAKKQPVRAPSSPLEDSGDSALPFRPVNRPPTLILCALDDGSRDDGEWYRVRKPEFRIGRTSGDPNQPNDIVIANDNGISSTHLEIKLRVEEGRYRYYLRDWPSRNGTFVRVSRAALRPEQELLIGARRYYLTGGSPTGNSPNLNEDGLGVTRSARGWEALSEKHFSRLPKLVEMTPRGQGHEFPLKEGENLLGSDGSQCAITISGDPFVSSTHALIIKDSKNRWVIENLNSLNGIWLRIEEMALDTGGEFQIGEQRFLVRIP
jgi:pSer/pThr/pTyr-binding forkhead associated (FHA) protein